jgi:hypothetical protein
MNLPFNQTTPILALNRPNNTAQNAKIIQKHKINPDGGYPIVLTSSEQLFSLHLIVNLESVSRTVEPFIPTTRIHEKRKHSINLDIKFINEDD